MNFYSSLVPSSRSWWTEKFVVFSLSNIIYIFAKYFLVFHETFSIVVLPTLYSSFPIPFYSPFRNQFRFPLFSRKTSLVVLIKLLITPFHYPFSFLLPFQNQLIFHSYIWPMHLNYLLKLRPFSVQGEVLSPLHRFPILRGSFLPNPRTRIFPSDS